MISISVAKTMMMARVLILFENHVSNGDGHGGDEDEYVGSRKL